MKIQDAFDSLSESAIDGLWASSRNLWIRQISPSRIGKVGEMLAQKVLGGTITANNTIGYDLDSSGKKIEVKLSSVVINDGAPILIWRQIRPTDPYTHLCLIAVYPNDVRLFLVPRDDIPSTALVRSHGGAKGGINLFQIHTRRIYDLPEWLSKNEVLVTAV